MYQITLRMARENCHLTIEEAAEKAEISSGTLRRWERNSECAKLSPSLRLLKVYGVSLNHVFFGREVDALERIRMMFDNDFKEVI
ncbi:helix-turn-helix transcriptional regulator [Paenibacillus sp. FA6]|uniref:helix-turn-helix transcriptional regulator n=1 Tax=Paenibacillus sp. FA6 TaxID=3413029 RepID=UPI003F65B4CA